jgi:putative PIN family toxin of toxin-antitoxin system
MTRVVIDTNVPVSALLKQHGAEAAVLFAVADQKLTWCVSPDILREYESVLRRPKFAHVPEPYVRALLDLAAEAEMVRPEFKVAEAPDEPDNRFLECAEAAGADYLVTGNTRHFPQHWKTTRVLNARQVITIFRENG